MCTTFPDIKYTQVSTTTYKGPNPQLVRTKSYNRVHLITSRINTSSIKHQLLYSQSYIALHSLQVFLKWTFSLRQITRDSFVYSPNETAARGAAELCPCVWIRRSLEFLLPQSQREVTLLPMLTTFNHVYDI